MTGAGSNVTGRMRPDVTALAICQESVAITGLSSATRHQHVPVAVSMDTVERVRVTVCAWDKAKKTESMTNR